MVILFKVVKRGEWLLDLQSQRLKNGRLNNYINNIRDNCRSCLVRAVTTDQSTDNIHVLFPYWQFGPASKD